MEENNQQPSSSVPENKRTKRKRLPKGQSPPESTVTPPPPRTRLALGAKVPKIKKRAAQCAQCGKWREIPTIAAYELVRANATAHPFVCEHASAWDRTVTCGDNEDVAPETDQEFLWALDEPDIPVTPTFWQRIETIRKTRGTKFADVKYCPPPPHNKGFARRSPADINTFLSAFPEYREKGIKEEHFSFKPPKPFPARADN